jgi:phage-related protein
VTYDRQVIAYKNYFLDFYEYLPDNVQSKVEWTLNLIRVTRQVPEKYFKHLEGTKGLYEIRVEVGNNIYRIFSFFDKGNLVVLGNAYQKKSQKTPNQELEKAMRVADFIELGELMCKDALVRNESCGGHFREEYQTEDGEAKRDDENFSFVSAWEYVGESDWKLNKEELTFEIVKPTQRSYK